MQKGKELIRDLKFYESYSKYRDELGRKETWEEAVDDVMRMHYDKFAYLPELKEHLDFATLAYKDRLVLASQRNLQYRKEQIVRSNARLYNCCSTYIDRPEVFKQLMFVLMNGCGAGYSVERRFVNKLPELQSRSNETVTYVIADSMEGWANAIDALMSSFFYGTEQIRFDGSLIRPEGAFISGGFKAPGYEPLRKALEMIENFLNAKLNRGETRLTSLDCHEVICMMADAVISAGVRRSALIALFDWDDELMLRCKTGDWTRTKPYLARANNSVKLLKGQFSDEDLKIYKEYIKQFGEPGIVFVDDMRFCTNPCAEIGFIPINPRTGKSCISFCNLTEINGGLCKTRQDFYAACRAAAILGTIQASYTDFSFLGEDTIELVEWEALIGVSITGLMDNPSLLFNADVLEGGAAVVVETNAEIARLIGINRAARCTTIKPSGNASVLLGTSSGIHPAHARRYFRVMQINKMSEIAQVVKETNPHMIEDSVWNDNGTDYVIYVPIVEDQKALIKEEITDIEFIDRVSLVYTHWVLPGTNRECGWSKHVTHNVSNTITVNDWDMTFTRVSNKQHSLGGVSFLPATGDKIYKQAAFTKVMSFSELVVTYGNAALFSSGLIVDALHAFNNDLWDACEAVRSKTFPITGDRYRALLQKDIIRRIKQFAKNYFNGNLEETITCLKDIHLYHKWIKIDKNYNPIEFDKLNLKPTYTDVNTMGASSCSGGSCEITRI